MALYKFRIIIIIIVIIIAYANSDSTSDTAEMADYCSDLTHLA